MNERNGKIIKMSIFWYSVFSVLIKALNIMKPYKSIFTVNEVFVLSVFE